MKKHIYIPLLTLVSTAQYCRIFSSLWVCSSCHRSGGRRLNGLSASCTPPAGSAHLTTGEVRRDKRTIKVCSELCTFSFLLLGRTALTNYILLPAVWLQWRHATSSWQCMLSFDPLAPVAVSALALNCWNTNNIVITLKFACICHCGVCHPSVSWQISVLSRYFKYWALGHTEHFSSILSSVEVWVLEHRA